MTGAQLVLVPQGTLAIRLYNHTAFPGSDRNRCSDEGVIVEQEHVCAADRLLTNNMCIW
jgi:hypothetical protein